MKSKHAQMIFRIFCCANMLLIFGSQDFQSVFAQDSGASIGKCGRRFGGILPLRRCRSRPCTRTQTITTIAHTEPVAASKPKWKSLFDGKTLKGWKITEFGGEGEIIVEENQIKMDFGDTLTGITLDGKFPKLNYEIRLDAMRTDGIDFFCGMTFPVDDSYCSFICGGWAGAVVGLSSIDGRDASENSTTRYMNFETGQWYKIRLRVTADKIQAWLDEKLVIDQEIRDHKISTRGEVDLSKPLGIAAWQTASALRNIEYRELSKNEIAAGK